MKLIHLIVITLASNIFAQSKIDSLRKIDFLEYDYKSIDKITLKNLLSSKEFDDIIIKYKFIPDKIKHRNDSLSVSLMAEFNDWDVMRVAKLQLTYDWKRIAYYLWLCPEESKIIAQNEGYEKAYYFKGYLENEEKHSEKIKEVINNIKEKIIKKEGDIFKKRSMKEILAVFFEKNPDRLRDLELYKTNKKNICTQEDCCQK
ncbi:MAG: hypothetical protein Q4G16_03645 [Cruoricaptor ignavus]|nr:hypothetical protein [Cruoricaptor ignavus]